MLGDSISMGYMRFVQEALKEAAEVFRPAENCQGTNHGVKSIDAWLAIEGGKWDVIHFNFGLHDLKHVDPQTGRNSENPNDPQQADPDLYRKNLEEIILKLKATGAKLIFATTTPFPPNPAGPYRDPEQVVIYNKIALALCEKYGIAVNDLCSFALPRLDELQQPANVHFKTEGSKALGEQVALSIKKMLSSE